MEHATPFILYLLLLVAVVAGLIAFSRHRAARRRQGLTELARRRGWRVESEIDGAGLLDGFSIAEKGHGQRYRNVLRGEQHGFEFAAFDYRYISGRGRNQVHYRQSIVLLERDGVDLPAFSLRPESVLLKLGGLFGMQDIDFESSPAFSSRYLLQGEHESKVRKLFDSGLRRSFEDRPGWSVEGRGKRLIVYRHDHRARVEELPGLVDEAVGIARRLTGA